jgi:hypothetical protein
LRTSIPDNVTRGWAKKPVKLKDDSSTESEHDSPDEEEDANCSSSSSPSGHESDDQGPVKADSDIASQQDSTFDSEQDEPIIAWEDVKKHNEEVEQMKTRLEQKSKWSY